MRNFIEGMLFIGVVIGLPILANLVVEVVITNVAPETFIKCIYFVLGLIMIHFMRKGR